MPIVVPGGGGGIPAVFRDAELAIHRQNTDWFIGWNPTDITLIPSIKTKTGSGTKITDGTPRLVQTFRLIPQSETTPPTFIEDGVERVVSFVLLGSWNCTMAPGDHWRDVVGELYTVLSVATFNGYEVKGLIEKHGAG